MKNTSFGEWKILEIQLIENMMLIEIWTQFSTEQNIKKIYSVKTSGMKVFWNQIPYVVRTTTYAHLHNVTTQNTLLNTIMKKISFYCAKKKALFQEWDRRSCWKENSAESYSNFRNVAITYMADSLRNEYRVVRLMNSCSVTFFGFVYNPTTLEH